MTAREPNAYGCIPNSNGKDCDRHEQPLECSHGCLEGKLYEHSCDDPPPPASPTLYDETCIGCGKRIPGGAMARLYEEGFVHADGCPERPSA